MSAKKCPNLPPLAASRPDYLGGRGSTLLVWVEDVVLRLHWRMARVSAVGEAFGIGRELVRCGFVVEHRVSPPTAFRKSLAVLFHEERLGKDVWHIHHEGRLRGGCARRLYPGVPHGKGQQEISEKRWVGIRGVQLRSRIGQVHGRCQKPLRLRIRVPYTGEGEGLHLPPVPEALNRACQGSRAVRPPE